MSITFEKNEDLQPGTWTDTLTPDGFKIMFRCLSCSSISSLPNHEIKPSGEVFPDVICPVCDWTEQVILDGWLSEEPSD